MDSIITQKTLIQWAAFNRYWRLWKIAKSLNREWVNNHKADMRKAKKENKELDLWIEGYIKKTDWGYIEKQEVEIPF